MAGEGGEALQGALAPRAPFTARDLTRWGWHSARWGARDEGEVLRGALPFVSRGLKPALGPCAA